MQYECLKSKLALSSLNLFSFFLFLKNSDNIQLKLLKMKAQIETVWNKTLL